MNVGLFPATYSSEFFANVLDKTHLLALLENDIAVKKRFPSIYFYVNTGVLWEMFSRKGFFSAFSRATYVHMNSSYLGIFVRILYQKRSVKLNAEDFFDDLLLSCERRKERVFLLGSSKRGNGVALSALRKIYTSLAIGGYHGYFEHDIMAIRAIKEFSPSVLIVGLGLGNQEVWIAKYREALAGIKAVVAVGNFIDALGKERSLPPLPFKKYGIEWVYRFLREPKRLWKRYIFGGILTVLLFLYCLFFRRIEFLDD